MRNVVLLLCVFSVLACPHECAIRQVAAACAHSGDCCQGCYSEHENSSQDESPQAPRPVEDGLSCFCDGAVFASGCEADLDLDAPAIYVPWSDSDPTCELMGRVGVHQSFAPTATTLDSKTMRIALRSLQL